MHAREQASRISQRDWLKVGAVGTASLGSVALGLWGFTVPGREHETGASLFEPGWLERRNPNRPEFITGEGQDGDRNYLKFMATHDPFMTTVLMEAYADFVNPHPSRPSIADTFSQHVGYAEKLLRPLGGSTTDSVHLAFFTMAAMYNDIFTPNEVEKYFYVHVPAEEGREDYTYWLLDYYRNVPQVFREDHGIEFGVDKVFHFANFGFLVHEYWYAKANNLQEADRVPNAAHVIADNAPTDKQEAIRLAGLGQYVLESYETLNWISNMFQDGRIIWPPSIGFFDPDYPGDVRANKLGIIFAALMARRNISKTYLSKAIDRLGNPEKLVQDLEILRS